MINRLNLKGLSLIIIAATFLGGCSESKTDKGTKKLTSFVEQLWLDITETEKLTQVVDQFGAPVEDAGILIGNSLNQPFSNNFIRSETQGFVRWPQAWNTTQSITIYKDGYIRATYLKQIPGAAKYVLRKIIPNQNIELNGNTIGHQVVNRDGQVDFAVAIPALDKKDFLAFDISQFISPQNDLMTVANRSAKIPSNVSIPKQTEKYYFYWTFEKLPYRLYFKNPGSQIVLTIRGTFPMNEVVDGLRNDADLHDLINYFSIRGGSIRELDLTQPKNTVDLPVDELNFSDKFKYTAPNYPSDQAAFVAALSEYKGKFLPTDFKYVESQKSMDLMTSKGSNNIVVTVLRKKTTDKNNKPREEQLSARLNSMSKPSTVQPLALIDSPQIQSIERWSAKAPQAPNGAYPLATFASLDKIESVERDGKTVEESRRVWEVYSNDWDAQFNLPEWPNPQTTWSGKMKWSVSYMGWETKGNKIDLGPNLVDSITHVTTNAQDFQNP